MKTKTTTNPVELIYGITASKNTGFRVGREELDKLLNPQPIKPSDILPKEVFQPQTNANTPLGLITTVNARTRKKFAGSLSKLHKDLYAKLLELAPTELSLPTAYADFAEALRLISNSREINVTNQRVSKATEELIELSIIRFLASRIGSTKEDADRIINRIWPQATGSQA